MLSLPESLIAVLELSLLLLLGKLGEEGFSKLNLMPFVGAILIGLIAGPGILKVFYPSPYISEFINLGIVFILFMAGVEETRLGKETRKAALAGTINFTMGYIILFIIALKMGFGTLVSSVLAISLAMVSAGPFSRTLQDIFAGAMEGQNKKFFIEVLFTEISAVMLFSFFAINALRNFETITIGIFRLLAIIIIILLFGKYAFKRILVFVEMKFRTWEALFAIVISIILLFGFLADLVGFNSAIAAFFLGVFVSEYVLNNAYLLEKLRALTYGFFEPLFFAGLGLYFVSLNEPIIFLGIIMLIFSLASKLFTSLFTSKLIGVDFLKNFFATSHKGGVDGAILLTALQLTLISPKAYSIALLAIMIMSVIAPLGFKGKSSLSSAKPAPSIKFVTYELSKSNAEKLSKVLPTVAVNMNASVEEAVKKADELNTRVLVIEDEEGRPAGYISVHDLFKMISFGEGNVKMKDVFIYPVPKVHKTATGSEVLDVFKTSDAQVVAVIDEDGKLIGTILEKEILRYLLKGEKGY